MTESKVELERKIESMEARLTQLKSQLRALETAEQHDAIDHLDESLQEVDTEYNGIRTLWPIVLNELRALKKK